MKATAVIQRASQAIANSNSSRLVEEAAKRISAADMKKRPRGLRKYANLMVVGVASVIATNSLQRRYEHNEYKSLAEARLERMQKERDEARQALADLRTALVDSSAEGVTAVDAIRARGQAGFDRKVEVLQQWIQSSFTTVARDDCAEDTDNRTDVKPKLV